MKTGKVSEVQVLHEEGLTNHLGVESCTAAGNCVGEALTDACAGWVLSLEIRQKLLGADIASSPAMARATETRRGRRPQACTDTPCAGIGRAWLVFPSYEGRRREGPGRKPTLYPPGRWPPFHV